MAQKPVPSLLSSSLLLAAESASLRRTDSGVFVLSLDAVPANADNRWTLEFCKSVHDCFDEIETVLAQEDGRPAALLTVSRSPKFFSNGIPLDWFKSNPPREEPLI